MNKTSWEDAFFAYSEMVFRMALSVLRDQDSANDVMQESFLRYGMNIGEIENAESWLKRVSWNLAISRFRENSRQRNQDLESLDILYTHDTHEIERNESLEALNKKIGRLPPKYRDSILDVANGLTLSEIGRRQGVNSRTAASRLFTARGLAKRVLAES